MPATYTDPTADYSNAVFTALEKEHIRNIIGLDALTELDTPLSEATAEQRKVTRYDIDLWFNEVGEGTVKVQGASDGVDFSTPRDRSAISQRMALRFGFSVASSSLFRIPVVSEHYYDACGDDY
jgi:hypothetical protein